jgi:hypothetical protein
VRILRRELVKAGLLVAVEVAMNVVTINPLGLIQVGCCLLRCLCCCLPGCCRPLPPLGCAALVCGCVGACVGGATDSAGKNVAQV